MGMLVRIMQYTQAKLVQEEQSLQHYIDEGVYDSEDVAGMEVWEVIEKISRRDFSAMDNLIWHYARITVLRELSRKEYNGKNI